MELETLLSKFPKTLKHKEDGIIHVFFKDTMEMPHSVNYDKGKAEFIYRTRYVFGYATYGMENNDLCITSGFSELEAAEKLYDWLKIHNYIY